MFICNRIAIRQGKAFFEPESVPLTFQSPQFQATRIQQRYRQLLGKQFHRKIFLLATDCLTIEFSIPYIFPSIRQKPCQSLALGISDLLALPGFLVAKIYFSDFIPQPSFQHGRSRLLTVCKEMPIPIIPDFPYFYFCFLNLQRLKQSNDSHNMVVVNMRYYQKVNPFPIVSQYFKYSFQGMGKSLFISPVNQNPIINLLKNYENTISA